ncbi:sterol desaturase family protein [Myxococcota bacterium]|nr:sterol desaturase family protein [Myxococcota bacterium]MCZ7617585.1 sterol desaturase family protein [Myxococcota bacterium]
MDDLLYLAIPLFLALLGLEQALLYRAQRAGRDVRGARREDTLASLAMGVGNVLISASVKVFLLAAYLWLYEHRLFDLGAGPAVWVLLFFVEDCTYYWWHRASHEVRFLWAAHVNHHSSEYYNYSTALRQSYTTPFTVPLFYWWLPLVGFHPLMIFTQVAISLLYQFWIHTETIDRLPRWFEAIFNTPSHHRVHHGANVEYLDRNHGGILILWDRLFGSFEPERARVRYGLTRNVRTYNPLRIAFHEWAALGRDLARASTWHARLGALFAAPGWSPDGTTKTSRQLRAEQDAERRRLAGVPDALAPNAPGLAS